MDGGAWQAAVHGVAKNQTRLSDFTFTFHAFEKEMATYSSILAWRIPWTGEPVGLPVYGVAQSWTRLKRLSSSSSSACFLQKGDRHTGLTDHFFSLRPFAPENQQLSKVYFQSHHQLTGLYVTFYHVLLSNSIFSVASSVFLLPSVLQLSMIHMFQQIV